VARSVSELIPLILAGAWRRRFLILVPILLLPPIGFAVGRFAPRTYETQMTILVQEPAKESPYLGDLAVGTRLEERMPVLTSLVMNERSLRDVLITLEKISETTPKAEQDRAISKLKGGLWIQLIGTDLVVLRLRGADAATLDHTLGLIGRRFIDKLTGPERSAIAASVAFLEREIAERRVSLQAADQKLAEFKARNQATLPEARSAKMERLTKLRESLDQARVALAGSTAMIAELRKLPRSATPSGERLASQLDAEIAGLSAEVVRLEAKYTEQHPVLRAKKQELLALQLRRERASPANPAAATRQDPSATAARSAGLPEQPGMGERELLRAARARQVSEQEQVAQLERRIAEVERELANDDDVQSELASLNSKIETEKDILDKLVRRYEMARVTGALGSFEAEDRVKIIDPPDFPTYVGPSPELFLFAGVLAGIALGLGLAIAAELGDFTIRRRSDLQRLCGIPMLGRIRRLPARAPQSSRTLDTPSNELMRDVRSAEAS
jgi:uncharacterized protein involved in exopolysaccharide biosynthesis